MCSAGPRCREAAISQRWRNPNYLPRTSAHGFGAFARNAAPRKMLVTHILLESSSLRDALQRCSFPDAEIRRPDSKLPSPLMVIGAFARKPMVGRTCDKEQDAKFEITGPSLEGRHSDRR